MSRTHSLLGFLCFGALALAATPTWVATARADEPETGAAEAPDVPDGGTPEAPAKPTPWADGIAEQARAAALKSFELGNEQFARMQYTQALDQYREAIAHWDHPSIRFNMVVCLIELDELVEAWHALGRALNWGQGPLSDRNHSEALRYKKMLHGSLAFVKLTCDEPGAIVTLDGKTVLDSPGVVERVMPPGEVQVVASKPGFMTVTKTVTAMSGRETVVALNLLPIQLATKTVRRWPQAVPWSVIGGGLAVGLAGIPLYLAADDDFKSYDRGVAADCPSECTTANLTQRTRDLKDRAETEYHASIVLFATGGAAVAAGVVLLLMNQPRTVEVDGQVVVEPSAAQLRVMPTPGGAYLNAELPF